MKRKLNIEENGGASRKKQKLLHSCDTPALKFEVYAEHVRARVSRITLPHGPVDTPVFMPVGTQATIKGLTTVEVADLTPQIILSNTYHLGHRPGTNIVDNMGGVHKFMNWNRNLLTDSGGFQMVSLLELATFSEEGVRFQDPMEGTELLLTPEKSIHLQNEIGSDIMMALDDVLPSTSTDMDRFKLATERTVRWLDRCIAAHQKPHCQNLFGIVQGGLDTELRDFCLEEFLKRDASLPGYAIGGLAGGESKDDFWRVVYQCTSKLPPNKPRYCMGIGFPLDLVVCSALGVDMFDCVYPCRTARFGTALIPEGTLRIPHKKYANDFRPVDETCECSTCQRYTRAALHALSASDGTCSQLLTVHNIWFVCNLMRNLRESIREGKFVEFVRNFLQTMFPSGIPRATNQWVEDALKKVEIDISDLMEKTSKE